MQKSLFIPFRTPSFAEDIPQELNDPFANIPPSLCLRAALLLQQKLTENSTEKRISPTVKQHPVRGKMYGVLVVKNAENEIGWLCAFSGKLTAPSLAHLFVPSLFDIKTDDYFLSKGMTELTAIGAEIAGLKQQTNSRTEIRRLQTKRRDKSVGLQKKLFASYVFLNQNGTTKNLPDIFADYGAGNPAAGTGECAAPKLLHYAFAHDLQPLGIAEFWWGKTSKSGKRTHGDFYPACEEKCRPILSFMLG